MESVNKPVYLYDTKDLKSIVRTALSEKEGPRWTAENCRSFSEIEFSTLVQALDAQLFSYYGTAAQSTRRGWCIIEGDVREKFILGCLANGVELTIIKWEGK